MDWNSQNLFWSPVILYPKIENIKTRFFFVYTLFSLQFNTFPHPQILVTVMQKKIIIMNEK